MKYPIGTMTAGDILSRGFRILVSRFVLLYVIMIIVELPILAVQLALPDFMVGGFGSLILLPLTFFLQAIGTGAMIRVIMQEYLDRPVSFAEAFQFALSRLGGLLGTSLLSGFLVFLGSLACLIPGIYMGITYIFASQAVIVENRSGMDALNRSNYLVSGYFWRVFGIVILIGLIAGIVGGAFGALTALAFPHLEFLRTNTPFPTIRINNYTNYVAVTSLNLLVQTFFHVFAAICTTLLYFDQRNRKESFDLELEADKLDEWTARFHPSSGAASRDIQGEDTDMSPQGTPQPPQTGIRPSSPDGPSAPNPPDL